MKQNTGYKLQLNLESEQAAAEHHTTAPCCDSPGWQSKTGGDREQQGNSTMGGGQMMTAVPLKAGIPVVPHTTVNSSIFITIFVLLIKQIWVDISKRQVNVLLSLIISKEDQGNRQRTYLLTTDISKVPQV